LLRFLIEEESTLDDHIVAHLNGNVTLASTGSRSIAIGFGPGHHFQVQDVHVIEEIDAIPASE
jgi:hypothetical protein